jgi:hypothetical protein
LVATLLLAVSMARTVAAAPKAKNAPLFGTPITLTFIALKAGQTYSIAFEKGISLTGKSENGPAGLQLKDSSLSYTPAADVAYVTFAVGGLIMAPDMTWNVQIPPPAALVISIPKADIVQYAVVAKESQTRIQLHTDVGAPGGCAIALDCALDNRCPLSPKRPLKCYGPLTSAFYCCSKDPMP